MFVIAPLNIDALKHYVHPDIYCSREVREVLDQNNFKFLGWLNSGIQLPHDVPFEKVYANRSGSYCIYGNFDAHMYYCVDMGD
jgi:hypothetical protein